MRFHLYISQEDISLVNVGMKVVMSLDATSRKIRGTISKIRPEATSFENNSVFVAEVELENKHDKIRPGMRGHARVRGESKSIGWILFRKPLRLLQRVAGF